jgi:hypothetical protein
MSCSRRIGYFPTCVDVIGLETAHEHSGMMLLVSAVTFQKIPSRWISKFFDSDPIFGMLLPGSQLQIYKEQ